MFVKDPIAITNICQSVKFIGHDQAHPLAERKLSNFGPCFNQTKVSKWHMFPRVVVGKLHWLATLT